MKDKVVPNTSHVKFKKTEVEEHPRISSISNQTKSVTACNDSLNSRTSNVNAVCATCGKCVFNSNHDACVSMFLKDVNARTKKPNVVPISTRKPKSQANKSVATPHKKTVASESTITNSKSYYRMLYKKTNKAWKWWIAQQCPSAYTWVPKTKRKWVPKVRNESVTKKIVQLILFIVDSGCTKHMTGNLSLLCNFVEKYLGTVRFGNDQFAPILGYGDLVQGNITIKRVYYVEGLNHNLFSVGQFCDADLEVAFRKSTCFVRDLQGNDLLTGNRGTDLYTISLQETTSSTPICLMAKASPTQAWLWHRRLSHLNFDYINLLSKKDVVIGLPKLKYVKDQLCSSCEVSKAKRSSFKSKTVPSSKGRLNLLHMDLCGPMRVASINGKKYILASDYDNPDPAPELQNVYPSANTTVSLTTGLDLPSCPVDKGFNDDSGYRWTQESPINSVRGNPSKQCKQEDNLQQILKCDELHQFDRLQVWELVDKPFWQECNQAKVDLKNTSKEVKRIFRYLRGTIHMGLWYPKGSGFELTAFSDADHAGCLDTRKSTSGGIQFLGDKLVSWMSKKQDCTQCHQQRLNTCLSCKFAQVMWMRTPASRLWLSTQQNPLYCDSQSAIQFQQPRATLPTEYQLADMFTKALPEERFQYLVRQIGMRCLTPAELEVLTKESA
ncbi:retrovirus-related pol polyprotein from transposon TNT 1-94 [Tanacetum coccineum]